MEKNNYLLNWLKIIIIIIIIGCGVIIVFISNTNIWRPPVPIPDPHGPVSDPAGIDFPGWVKALSVIQAVLSIGALFIAGKIGKKLKDRKL